MSNWMSWSSWRLASQFAALGLWVNAAHAQPQVTSTRQWIVYGTDDRVDAYASTDARLTDLAWRSSVALIPASRLANVGGRIVPSQTVGALSQISICPVPGEGCTSVCPDEAFASQPAMADCSGVLIDDDLVLTAGHCFDDGDSCAIYSYVFGYAYDGPDSLASIDPGSVYGCRRIVRRVLGGPSEPVHHDYAIVQLDRPVDALRVPVALRDEPFSAGDAVAAIGFPVGLPVKVDNGGRVQDARARQQDFFTATTDTFVGNSGSGLYDSAGRLAGHLVLGGEDFQEDPFDDCLRVVVIPDDEVPPLYEHGVYTQVWRDELCTEGWPSARLCDFAGECGDRVCAGKETLDNCPADCGEPACIGSDLGCNPIDRGLPQFSGDELLGGRPSQEKKSGGRCSIAPPSAVSGWGSALLAPLSAWLWRRRRGRAV